MDQTVEPQLSEFIIDVDGVPKTPIGGGWYNATTWQLTYSEVALGPSVVKLQYPDMFPNFISLAGQPVFPFDLLLSAI